MANDMNENEQLDLEELSDVSGGLIFGNKPNFDMIGNCNNTKSQYTERTPIALDIF